MPDDPLSPTFLLSEFQALQQARSTILAVRDRQINLYISLASVVTAASVVGQAIVQPENRRAFLLSVGLALVAFSLFGVILAYRAVQAQLSSTVYVRGMSRIRRYFTEHDSSLHSYLILPVNDDIPRFSDISFFDGALARVFGIDIFAFVNAAAVHLGTSLLVVEALPRVDRWFGLVTSFLSALAFLSLQLTLHRYQVRRVKFRFDVRFPSKPPHYREPGVQTNP